MTMEEVLELTLRVSNGVECWNVHKDAAAEIARAAAAQERQKCDVLLRTALAFIEKHSEPRMVGATMLMNAITQRLEGRY